MSNQKLLSHTDNGYIIRCNNCNQYRIAFGTLLTCFSEEQFDEFKKDIREQFDFFPHDGFHDQKIIHIFLPSQTTCMVLNYKELEKLSGMIAEVDLMQQVEALLY